MFLDAVSVVEYKNFLSLLGTSNYNKFSNFSYGNIVKHEHEVLQQNSNYLIVNSNFRLLDPIFQFKLRRMFLESSNFYYVGSYSSFNFFIKYVSNNLKVLYQFAKGKHWLSCIKPIYISDVVNTPARFVEMLNKVGILSMVLTIYTGVNSWYNFMFVNGVNSQNIIFNYLNININFGFDNILYKNYSFNNVVSFYAGHHKDIGVLFANIICPARMVFEKNGSFINYFQNVVFTTKIINGIKGTRIEYEILQSLKTHFFEEEVLFIKNLDTGLTSYIKKYGSFIKTFNTMFKCLVNVKFAENVYVKSSKTFINSQKYFK